MILGHSSFSLSFSFIRLHSEVSLLELINALSIMVSLGMIQCFCLPVLILILHFFSLVFKVALNLYFCPYLKQ